MAEQPRTPPSIDEIYGGEEKYTSSSVFEKISTKDWYDMVAHLTSKQFCDSDEIKILDFGGGDGVAYDEINQRLGPLEYHLDWNIVEIAGVIEKYKNPQNEYPLWHLQVSDVDKEIDVVYADGAIQCVSEWEKTLAELCSKNPKWIFIHRLPAGDFKTAKAKTRADRREVEYGLDDNSDTLVFWFFNIEDFLEQLDSLGYSLYDSHLYGYHYDWFLIEDEKINSQTHRKKPRSRVSLVFEKTN